MSPGIKWQGLNHFLSLKPGVQKSYSHNTRYPREYGMEVSSNNTRNQIKDKPIQNQMPLDPIYMGELIKNHVSTYSSLKLNNKLFKLHHLGKLANSDLYH